VINNIKLISLINFIIIIRMEKNGIMKQKKGKDDVQFRFVGPANKYMQVGLCDPLSLVVLGSVALGALLVAAVTALFLRPNDDDVRRNVEVIQDDINQRIDEL